MKAIIGKLSLLALAVGLAGVGIVSGCSSTADKTSEKGAKDGSVGFALDVGGGVSVNTMKVVVFGNGLGVKGASTNIVKTLDVSGISGTSASFTLVLPAGANYQVELSSPDNASCTGTGTFSVAAGQSSTINVTMSCTPTSTTGQTNIGVNACSAQINSVFIGPNTTAVGKAIVVDATATPGVTYMWSATGNGSFAAATSASTTFTCGSAGNPTLTLTVTGATQAGAACTDSKTFPVTCTAPPIPSGGAGGDGTGGTSGGASGGIAGGGTSGGVAGGGAGGSFGGSSGGASGGTSGGAPPSFGGASGGTSGGSSPGTGGGPVVQQCPSPVKNVNGTETCTAKYTSNECGDSCSQITKDACLSCELNSQDTVCYGTTADGSSVLDCNLVVALSGPTTSSGESRFALCNEALECFRKTKCGQVNQLSCYCGTSGSTCVNQGAANGPCRSVLERALESTVPAEIFARYADPSYAGGLALIREACDNVDCPVCYSGN